MPIFRPLTFGLFLLWISGVACDSGVFSESGTVGQTEAQMPSTLREDSSATPSTPQASPTFVSTPSLTGANVPTPSPSPSFSPSASSSPGVTHWGTPAVSYDLGTYQVEAMSIDHTSVQYLHIVALGAEVSLQGSVGADETACFVYADVSGDVSLTEMQGVELEALQEGNILRLTVSAPENSDLHVRLQVQSEAWFVFDILSGDKDVRVDTMMAELGGHVSSDSGSVHLLNTFGDIHVEAQSGEVLVDNELHEGHSLRVDMGAGPVRVQVPRGLAAAQVVASTEDGQIIFEDLECIGGYVEGSSFANCSIGLVTSDPSIRVYSGRGDIVIAGR